MSAYWATVWRGMRLGERPEEIHFAPNLPGLPSLPDVLELPVEKGY